jgi:CRP-like cAMP-binding protein
MEGAAMISNETLRLYSLFAGLPDDALDVPRPRFRREMVAPGEAWVTQGSSGDRVHCILEGTAEVFVDGESVAKLTAGQQFGEMHLVDVQERSASVVALTALITLSLNTADLIHLKRANAEAALMLMLNCARDVSRRLRVMNRRYVQAQHELERLQALLAEHDIQVDSRPGQERFAR